MSDGATQSGQSAADHGVNEASPANTQETYNAAHWQETVYRRAVEKNGERQPEFTTSSEIVVAPLYT